MAKIFIDGKPYEAADGQNLLEACLSLGFDLPYFCWHPSFGSVGACRQCAVKKFKDENDTKGKLFMACMEPATDNTRLSIHDPEAVEFRKGIIEWLMTNHPHDCPVCDEGGECHLQDMTVMTGHDYRRFRFNKRTYPNQYLGPHVNHEMNRCIQCYRCVRFYRDYADGRDLDVFAAHNHVYFGRHKDGVLENEFSGNLVEVCPTGVFTDKTLKKHYTRKWDLTAAPSICAQCSVGCNTIAGERYGSLRRILSRYNGEVNGYFICDRGRFGYEYVNDKRRIKAPQSKENANQNPQLLDRETTLAKAKEMLSGRIVGVGSPRASLESNFTLKNLVGSENFYAGENRLQFTLAKKIRKILQEGSVKTPSLKEIEKCDVVLILGEDITNTAPMMALAVRQAARRRPIKMAGNLKIPHWHDAAVRELVQEDKGPVFTLTPYPTKLNDIAAETIHALPDRLADAGFAIAHAVDPAAPKTQSSAYGELIERIAHELKNAEKPLIISGTACGSERLIEASYQVAKAVSKSNSAVRLGYALPECNSLGLAMMADKDLDDLLEAGRQPDALIVLENDLYRRKDKEAVDRLFESAKRTMVLDHLENHSTEQAELLIPAGTFAESDGTFVNNEGRAQRFYQVYAPFGEIWESWRWLDMIADAKDATNKNFDDVVAALTASHPQFAGIETLTPPSDFRKAGQKIPRQPHRHSGRTAMHADKDVHEPKPPEDPDSPLQYSMEGYRGEPPSSVIPFFWSPGWNSAQAINKYQIEVGGPLHDGDPGRRLFEPPEGEGLKYFEKSGKSRAGETDKLTIVRTHHIFGSDELSSLSPGIAELAPEPYAGLSPEYAAENRLTDAEKIVAVIKNTEYELPIKIIKGLPKDAVALPAGLRGFPFDFETSFATIKKKSE